MYTVTNFKSKKALREWLDAHPGELLRVFQPGPFGDGPREARDGDFLEGPHYPEPHRWYGAVKVRGGKVTIS